jgi:hypothetical protein
MLFILLSLLPILAEEPPGINVSLQLLITAGGGLVAAVVAIFWLLIGSYEKRIAEMNAAHDKRQADMSASQEDRVHEMAESNRAIAEEVAAQWRATDRSNRLNAMRMISSQQVSGEFKEEARAIISEIDSERENATHRLKN